MESSRVEAERDGVVVPTTLEEYCVKAKLKPHTDVMDSMDFYEYYDYGDDDEDEDGNCCDNDNEDSGQGES